MLAVPERGRLLFGLLPPPPRTRSLVAVFALGWSIAAVAFAFLTDEEAAPLGFVWPVLFGLAAIACWAFWADPSSRRALIASGGLSFVGVLSRSAGVAQNLITGSGPAELDPAYAVLGLVIYPLFAIALLFVWDQGFAKLWASRQHRGEQERRPGASGDHPRS